MKQSNKKFGESYKVEHTQYIRPFTVFVNNNYTKT